MDNSDSKMYISEYGNKIYKNSKGKYHRLDGPAIEYANGDKSWYKENLRHRIDGPAREWVNGYKYWFILDKELEEKEFNSWISRIQKCI